MNHEELFYGIIIGILCTLIFKFLSEKEKKKPTKEELELLKYPPGTGVIKIATSLSMVDFDDKSTIDYYLDGYNIKYVFARVANKESLGEPGEHRTYRYTIEYWEK